MGEATVNRKPYWVIFLMLAVLTALEVGVVEFEIGKFGLYSALILLAVGKAWLVLWFFMHLNHEAKGMKWTVYIPFLFPAVYAFALIADAAWRGLKVLG